MKIALIGYPLSGKTTVFNTLTGLHARVDGFITSGKEANVGLIKVPDNRIDRLSEIFQPKKTTFAEISFVDVGGITATGTGGIDAQSLSYMRTVDAFTVVARAFEDEAVSHPLNRIDPAADVTSLEEEMALSDLMIIEKRMARLEKESKRGSAEHVLLERCNTALGEGKPLRELGLSEEEKRLLAGFQFLTLKPRLVLINTGESNLEADPALIERFGGEAIAFCAALEQQISELGPSEQAEFLEAMGIDEPARPKFIRAAYALLDLISFFTVGKDEVRAWTINRGTDAVNAAGKIHSDIQRGFIRAEVVSYEDFSAEPNMNRMKELGKLRLEGKTYPVQDGDIINFRFNV